MYPSRVQYKIAVMNEMFPKDQNGGYYFQPVIQNGEPIIAAGGNATVFKVKDQNGVEYALKLFSNDLAGRFNRLNEISQYLDNSNFSFFTHFKFIENLIYVEMPGQSEEDCFFPGVAMYWINGDMLDSKIEELTAAGNKNDLKIIAENFKNLALALLENRIAHGDLKLSNILVNKNYDLFLVDYDGMYIPSLKGQKALEKGTVSYQHPNRTENHFDDNIDHSSILNIYASLKILSEKPELFIKFNDGDNIIFKKEDLDNPTDSDLFRILTEEKVQSQLIYHFKKSLSKDSIEIDNIIELLKGNFPKPSIAIIHSPLYPVIGQVINLNWNTYDADFLMINKTEQPLNGTLQIVAENANKIILQYGTGIEEFSTDYLFSAEDPPRVVEFKVSNQDLKFDEPLTIFWKIENAKKAILNYNDNEIDVTDLTEYTFQRLSSDTRIGLILESNVNDYRIIEEVLVKVYYPIKLSISQNLNVVFRNRPVMISVRCENAEQIILKPFNTDITDKEEFELRTEHSLSYKIVASNKRYIEEVDAFIDVLKPPSFERKLIELSPIHIDLPKMAFSLLPRKDSQHYIDSFERKSIKIARLLDSFNIFKIRFNRKSYEGKDK